MRRISKLLGGLLAGVTASTVLTIASVFGVKLDPTVAAAIATLAAAIGTYFAPPNEEGVE